MRPDYSYANIENSETILNELLLSPSSVETIDTAMLKYIDEKVNLSSQTNEGFKKVPIIWAGAERAYQIKHRDDLRDENGSLLFPLITIERTSLEKDPTFKGSFQAHIPDGPGPKRVNVPLARRIVADKSAEFKDADIGRYVNGILSKDPRYEHGFGELDSQEFNSLIKTQTRKNKKTVFQTVYGPIPVYVKVMYSVVIKTNYQMQMNDLITPFVTIPGQINAVYLSAEGHRYEAFIEGSFSYSNNITAFESEERVFETTINFRVLGYLMGEGPNAERPKFSLVENVVQVRIPRERVITMDKNYVSKKSFYRD